MEQANKENLTRFRDLQKKSTKVIDDQLNAISKNASSINEAAIQAINKFDLPEPVENILLSVAASYDNIKDGIMIATDGFKMMNEVAIEVFEQNVELNNKIVDLHDELKYKNEQLTKLQVKLNQLNNQTIWSFLGSKLRAIGL